MEGGEGGSFYDLQIRTASIFCINFGKLLHKTTQHLTITILDRHFILSELYGPSDFEAVGCQRSPAINGIEPFLLKFLLKTKGLDIKAIGYFSKFYNSKSKKPLSHLSDEELVMAGAELVYI